MYSTVTEIYNAIDIGTQMVNSDRRRTFQRPELDVLFNRNLLRFIENRSTSKSNVKQEGFDDSVKRISDLQDLKTTTGYLKTKKHDDNTVYIDLPENYKLFYSGRSKQYYNCVDFETKYISASISKTVLKFTVDTTSSSEFYKNFKLTVETVTGLKTEIVNVNNYNFPTITRDDARFMLINTITNSKTDDIVIYWENYSDMFVPDSLIIIDLSGQYKFANISYDGYTLTSQFSDSTYDTPDVETNMVKPIELIASDKFDTLSTNYYQMKNRYNKPRCKIEKRRLYVEHDSSFIPAYIELYYIATPIFINYFTNQMTNLRLNIEEIIDMTVEDIKSILTGTYQTEVNRNLKIE